MSKFVNLDELAAPNRSVKFRGKDHQVREFSVRDFITFQKDLKAMQDFQAANDEQGVVEVSEKIIADAIPTIQGDVRELNVRQMYAVVGLIAEVYPTPEDAPKGNVEPPKEVAAPAA